ncbi:MAG: 23S rRNA (pseudouridine1915-N3)-methyltransferase [Lentimonas sp.]|jgi:23S rRNA (pseudouridine1915-N3)-methyltransferase
MFHFTLITIGRIKSRPLASLSEDFAKRLTRQGKFEQIELKDGTVDAEGKRILEALSKRKTARVYALAEEGATYTSTAFANELLNLQGKPTVFVIGGAYGLSQEVKDRADVRLSLSPFTFTHEIARMLLCEQLYRAVSINTGSNYHHV